MLAPAILSTVVYSRPLWTGSAQINDVGDVLVKNFCGILII